jgi:peptidoglycan/xylan/chitin deacetylase (PgdA/CDA1 family)
MEFKMTSSSKTQKTGLAKSLAFLVLFFISCSAVSADSAVILLYHHFGARGCPSTNTTLKQLDEQIRYLQEHHFNVLPVPEIIDRLKRGDSLPNKTIGITIDDGYKSVYTKAWPRFKTAGFPFTIFVSTDGVDHHYGAFMTWAQIRELSKNGVTIGNHTATHGHLTLKSALAAEKDIQKAQNRLSQELNIKPTLFAYPYGERNKSLRATVIKLGFDAAFLQSTGPFNASSDFFALHRFALNEQRPFRPYHENIVIKNTKT